MNSVAEFRQGIPGIYRALPAVEYHRLSAISSSALKKVHTASPKHCKATIDNPDLISGESVDIGGGAHALTLTPSDFDGEFLCAGQCEATVKASGLRCLNSGVKLVGGSWLCGVHGKGQENEADDKTILTLDEFRRVKGIRDAVWANDTARKILQAADEVELSLLWVDEDTGLLNKARLDLLCTSIGVMPDLKTCRSIKHFPRDTWDRAYHIQLAHYRRTAVLRNLPVDIPTIIAVESEEPYDVAVFRPTDRFMDLGLRDLNKAMKTIADCHRSGVWPGVFKGTQFLDAPDWAA